MVKKVWDIIMGAKSEAPFFLMSRLVKILKLSKTLNIGMVLHVTAGCVRVDLD